MAKRAVSVAQSGEYRISELVKKSGTSREMIKYYLRDGLLPPARKPRRNLSLYSDQHLQLIALIQRFRDQTKLSLGDIADAFATHDFDPHRLEMALVSGQFSQQTGSSIVPLSDYRAHDRAGLAFDQSFISLLHDNGLLESDALESADDEKIATVLWKAQEADIPLSLFVEARKHLLPLAELQINALISVLPVTGDPTQGIELHAHADRLFNGWLIADKTQLLRRKYQKILDDTEQDVAHSLDAIYIPSEVFRKRFRVDASIDAWRSESQRTDMDANTRLQYAMAAMLLAEFDVALELCRQDSGQTIDTQRQLAVECTVLCMQKRMDAAGECYRRLSEADDDSIWSSLARLLYLLLRAAELGALSDASEILAEALALYQRALEKSTTESPIESFELKLLRGRACVMFSKWIQPDEAAVVALQDMLKQLNAATADELGLPGDAVRVVYQVYCHFYLARIYQALGDTEAASEHFQRVVMLDPASNFGEHAYLQLAD